jgi:hypothetical protein
MTKLDFSQPDDETLSEELPEGWVRAQLGAVVWPSKNRIEPSQQPNAPYLGLEHIESHSMKVLGHGRASDVKSTKAVFDAGDVLYGKLRPYLNKVCVPDFAGVCSTDFLVFDQKPWLDSRFLLWSLLRREVVEYANHHSTGVELPRISYAALASLDFWLPPTDRTESDRSKDRAVDGSRQRSAGATLPSPSDPQTLSPSCASGGVFGQADRGLETQAFPSNGCRRSASCRSSQRETEGTQPKTP